MRHCYFYLILFSFCFACKPQQKIEKEPSPIAIVDPIPDSSMVVFQVPIEEKYNRFEKRVLDEGFVDLLAEDSTLVLDLRYSTMNNFMDTIIYDSIHHAFGVVELSEQLKTAGNYLRAERPGHSFMIFDCLRPRSVQRQMWARVKNTAQEKYVAELLQQGELKEDQVQNRILFRTVMRKAGFHPIDSEWWHFNLTNRDVIRSRYSIFE